MINVEKLRAVHIIFFFYILISAFLIMVFRFIFPGSEIPLLIFSAEWRLIQGLLAFLNLFPALALSALVIPFGLVPHEGNYSMFSQDLFKRMITSVVVAIIAAAIYAVIFFLVFPMAKNYEENIRYKAELFHISREQAQNSARSGEWKEASQFLAICDRIWPNNRDLDSLRIQIQVNLARIAGEERDARIYARTALAREWRNVDVMPYSGRHSDVQPPATAAQAMALSETAYTERRYFESHWFATTAQRLSPAGSPDAMRAAQLASRAWNQIASLAPNPREVHRHFLHRKKVSGYQAMNSGNWIQAYYIFLELKSLTPDDPDVHNFFNISEQAVMEKAFFIDDLNFPIGRVLTGAVFSIPRANGRTVLRFLSLSASQDFANGTGLELMEFDEHSRLITNMRAPYARLLPVTLNERQQVLIKTHALNRHDNALSKEGEWLLGSSVPGGIVLDISFEDFLLLVNARQGLSNLHISELFLASRNLGSAGYIPQVFQAEILNRIGTAVFFLPMAILIIVMGWRFRPMSKKPRYFFVLLLPVLPVVFHGFVSVYRTVLNLLGIWLTLNIGFSAALIVFIAVLTISVIGSMIIMAAQHNK